MRLVIESCLISMALAGQLVLANNTPPGNARHVEKGVDELPQLEKLSPEQFHTWFNQATNTATPEKTRSQILNLLVQGVHDGVNIPSQIIAQLPEQQIPLLPYDQQVFAMALADAFLREGDAVQAWQIYGYLLATLEDPLSLATTHLRYARALFSSGLETQAQLQWEALSEVRELPTPFLTLTPLTLARYYAAQGDQTRATNMLNVALNTSNPPAHLLAEARETTDTGNFPDFASVTNALSARGEPIPQEPTPGLAFFVAPTGSDSNDGTMENPFATLERARDAVRAQRVRGRLPAGGVAVYLRGGVYAITNTFTLTEIDSGNFGAPVLYSAWQDETPIMDSGFTVNKLYKVSDTTLLSRLAPPARGKVFRAKVTDDGYDLTKPQQDDNFSIPNAAIRDLFQDGEPLPVARSSKNAAPTLDQLDSPGKWYLDRFNGYLYVWPPRPPRVAPLILSYCDAPLIKAENVREVIVKGLTLRHGQQHGMTFTGCMNSVIRNNTLLHFGHTGVRVLECANLRLYNNIIRYTSHTGMYINGGNRRNLTASQITVDSNEISHVARRNKGHGCAILVDGCGVQVVCNRLHHTPSSALRVVGNDHIVEHNLIEHALQDDLAQGALQMYGNPSYQGNVIRHNHWRDIGAASHRTHRQACIRLERGACGTLIYHNVFENRNASNTDGVSVIGGQGNIIDNNMFIGCGINFTPLGDGAWRAYLAHKQVVHMLHTEVDIFRPPYSRRYPTLAHLSSYADYNSAWRNRFVSCPRAFRNLGKRIETWDNLTMPAH